MITEKQRNYLLTYASGLASDRTDVHRVVEHARALEAWVTAVGDAADARLRMQALDRVYYNLDGADALPADDPDTLTGKAECMYAYLGGDVRPGEHADDDEDQPDTVHVPDEQPTFTIGHAEDPKAPSGLLPALTRDGERVFVELGDDD